MSDSEYGPPSGSVVAIACVLLQKQDGATLTTCMTQCWREGIEDEDQIRGIAVVEAIKAKPCMGVLDVLTAIIRTPNKVISKDDN